MNNTLLNISEKISEPIINIYDLIAKIANQQNIRFFVIGATARDIVFEYGYNIPAPRMTRDIDLAVQVATWDEFQNQILSAETGEQKHYRLVEAMTNRQRGQHFENNLALLNALYLGFNEKLHKIT